MGGRPWVPGAASGVGSLPGEDPREAVRLVLGELPGLPHLPELPARGPGADLLGRTAALLVDLPVDLQPSGWRLVARPGRDLARARDLLARDLDALEEGAAGYPGPLKVQAAGPWTLAAGLALPRGEAALADPGATRDVVDSLAEGLRGHLAELSRRVPGARWLLQLDEPGLPAVLAGRVPTATGFATLPAVAPDSVRDGLTRVLAGLPAYPVVHCCAAAPPVRLLRAAGVAGLSLDAATLPGAGGGHGTQQADRLEGEPAEALDEALGEALSDGAGLLLGTVPATEADPAGRSGPPPPSASVAVARALWRRLGLDPADLPAQVVLTPTCGLAGASPAYARRVLAHCQAAAAALLEDPEG